MRIWFFPIAWESKQWSAQSVTILELLITKIYQTFKCDWEICIYSQFNVIIWFNLSLYIINKDLNQNNENLIYLLDILMSDPG